MPRERKTEISYLNMLLCLFVIFIHIISFAVAGFDIYLYHMLFVFLSNFVIEKLSVQSHFLGFIIRCIFAYGLTIPCCILFGHIKKRLKAFREVKKND